MSLFGSLMGDCEDDPFFGPHMQSMQRMNSMMNSMFADPFGLMGQMQQMQAPAIMDGHNPHNRMVQMPGMQMMPFGFPPMPSLNIGRMFSNLNGMSNDPNCHSFTSSSIMTMTSGPDGRPQVYQESMSSRTAPGGVKETKKTVSDSRTGTRKMAIGHHIGERAHIIEREQNYQSGDQEERQEFINLEEEEAETFNREWETKTKRTMNAIGGSSYRQQPNPYSRSQQEHRQLALPSTAPAPSSDSRQPSRTQSRPIAKARRAIRTENSTSRANNSKSTSRSAESTTTSSSPRAAHSNGNSSHHQHQHHQHHQQQHQHQHQQQQQQQQHHETSSTDTPQNLSTTSRKREHSPEIIETIVHNNHKRQSTSPNNSARNSRD
ncbi:myeloid leukemia factor 2 isoform X1 [Nasonia vitripennis]|uniref:Myeloid leukemia factor n=1 Tax=Nasonia vitripennis TaxID=7425 RepID=A0A7M7G404_NASVI|nr:myeloid leukemia factor 2 isoform X1 [Nasonia vitripennis]